MRTRCLKLVSVTSVIVNILLGVYLFQHHREKADENRDEVKQGEITIGSGARNASIIRKIENNVEALRKHGNKTGKEPPPNQALDEKASWPEENLEELLAKVNKSMAARRRHVREVCKRFNRRKLDVDNDKDLKDIMAKKGNLDTFFWNDKYRFVTSVIFKAGSSNWRNLLVSLTSKAGEFRDFPPQLRKTATKPLQMMSSFKDPLEVKYRLKWYTKIVTVRHPLIRFLSAYRDKFVENIGKFRKDIPEKIKTARRTRGRRENTSSDEVTFLEFTEFVTKESSGKAVKNMDAHWTPMHVRCRPCAHDFELIAKLETSGDDMKFIGHVLGIDQLVRYQSAYTSRHQLTQTKSVVMTHYRQLTDELLQKLCDFYELDFELFGYYRPQTVADVERIFEDFF